MTKLRVFGFVFIVFSMTFAVPESVQAQGLQFFGIGPVNRSMGGAATAAPIEAIGALAYNPATMTDIKNQLSVGGEFVTPLVEVNSSFAGNSGQTKSDSGWLTVPTVGLSWRPTPESPITYGFGLLGIAGYALNYPSSTTNPILFPQTPTPQTPTAGFGKIFADVSIQQIIPSVALKVTDQLSVSAGPTISSARIIATPFAFASPNPTGSGGASYPVGSGTEYTWGMGFQLGVYWKGENDINLGASYKSPQWFLPIDYHGTTATGLPRDFSFQFNYPQIVSLGAGYTGIERWLFATDVRYFDWKNSGVPGNPAQFAPDGTLTGMGWRSTWSVSLGTQYQMTDTMSLRAGYAYSDSPITNSNAGYNVGTPLILQHSLNLGTTMQLSKNLAAHLAYYYAPESRVSGPFESPSGPVAGSNVSYRVTAQAISLGLTASF